MKSEGTAKLCIDAANKTGGEFPRARTRYGFAHPARGLDAVVREEPTAKSGAEEMRRGSRVAENEAAMPQVAEDVV